MPSDTVETKILTINSSSFSVENGAYSSYTFTKWRANVPRFPPPLHTKSGGLENRELVRFGPNVPATIARQTNIASAPDITSYKPTSRY